MVVNTFEEGTRNCTRQINLKSVSTRTENTDLFFLLRYKYRIHFVRDIPLLRST
jgi:hypothetical protein